MKLEFLKGLPGVKRWAEEHKISEVEMDDLLEYVRLHGDERTGETGYAPGGRDDIGDFRFLKVDMEGTVIARDDVARAGIVEIFKILKGKP